jgi:uncharacterized membrane protein YraQ (UPF0718 family)
MQPEWERNNHQHGFSFHFTKDVVIPLFTPTIIAILGIWFTYLSDRQRNSDAENQKQAEIMRDFVTNRNRPDVAFFTAVGTQLTIHLQRYQKVRGQPEAKELKKEALEKFLDKNALFDETAAYFFSGMFRVALIDFYATKGYVLYGNGSQWTG